MQLPSCIQKCINVLFFLLPWQTVWIYKEPFINGAKWQYGTLGFYATELIAWGIIILFLVHYIGQLKRKAYLHDRNMTRDRLFVVAGGIFFVYLFIASFFAPFPDVAHQHILRMMLVFLLFIVCSTKIIDEQESFFWFVVGSIPASILGIWQFLSQSTIDSSLLGLASHHAADAGTSIIAFAGERWLRAYGPMAHPNIFGGYLFFVLAACMYYWVNTPIASYTKNFFRQKEMVTLVAALLASSALFFSFSRSAWIAAGVLWIGTLFLFLKQHLGVRFHIVIVVPIVILSIVYASLLSVRIGATSTHEQISINERVSGIMTVKEIIHEHIWLGTGVGNYTAALYVKDPARPGWLYQPVHSVPALLVAEIGIVGSVLLCFWLVSFLLLYWRILWRSRYWVGSLLFGSLSLYLLDHYLFSSFQGIILGVILVVLMIRPRFIHILPTFI